MMLHPLEVEMVPLAELLQHPENTNNGDIEALAESVRINGFYSPVIVQRSTGFILAGNHRYVVAMMMDPKQSLPVIYLDVSDDRAKRIMLADNAITRRGHDDEAHLLDLLQELHQTELGLKGTGFEDYHLLELAEEALEPLKLTATESDQLLDSLDGATKPKLQVTATPIVAEDGDVYEVVVEVVGMGPIPRATMDKIRRALGLEPMDDDEIQALGITRWGKRRR